MSRNLKLIRLANDARKLMSVEDRTQEPWFSVQNAADESATVRIFGAIGDPFEGLDAAAFVDQLDQIAADTINLQINSPGGLVFDGVAIYDALQSHSATVDVLVSGVAASAASFIAMAGDSVAITKSSKMMIHDAAGLVIGNAQSMRQMADLLDDLSDTIADVYADRSGRSADEWRAAMRTESWYGSADAVAAGLADRVANDKSNRGPSGPDNKTRLIRVRHEGLRGGL